MTKTLALGCIVLLGCVHRVTRADADETAYSECYWNMRRAGIEAPLAGDVLACQAERSREIRAENAERRQRLGRALQAGGEALTRHQDVHCTSTTLGGTTTTDCR